MLGTTAGFGLRSSPFSRAQRAAFEASRIAVMVVKRTDAAIKRFVVLPKRFVAERTPGGINRAQRLSKDFEATIESALAWLQLALAFLIMRSLARLKTAAAELGAKGIRAHAISPGPLRTRAASGIDRFDELLARAAAEATEHQLVDIGDGVKRITGTVIPIDGGQHVMA